MTRQRRTLPKTKPPKNVPPVDCPHCPTTHSGVKGYLVCLVCGTLSVVV